MSNVAWPQPDHTHLSAPEKLPWLPALRNAVTRDDDAIYCFASPSDAAIDADNPPYVPNWVDVPAHIAKQAQAYLSAPYVVGIFWDMDGTWDIPGNGQYGQIAIANRLANKIDTVN
jgi:hypothetical protein